MKTFILLLLTLGYSFFGLAQDEPINIVFDVTSDNPKTQAAAVRHAKAMSKAYPNAQFEVVMYSGAINMALPDKSPAAADIAELINNSDNVTFVMCNGTLKRHNLTQDKLIKGIKVVPDGILEIVTKQKQGWGYIKESN
ncbi:DsrE family protein [Mangrovimonas aestuarii]|uniref:DsrE family protein n=1 Tax=Mangrovimonas aestuarii TaxID=3018443 RepID=UPI002379E370|nr:DsrE family protein [Mangrovimonas aestuarii]